jgi:hypothetical protein
MGGYKEANFSDRLKAQGEARKAALEKFKAQPGRDDPQVAAREAERRAISEARDARQAEKKAAREAEEARLAAEKAALEAEEAAKRVADEAALEVERQAARDARYAARKARKKQK